MKDLKFKIWPCRIKFSTYANGGGVAIQLEGAGQYEGELIATATVNFPDQKLSMDRIAIKEYSENEGMVEFLIASNIIQPEAVGHITSGFITAPIHKLTDHGLQLRG